MTVGISGLASVLAILVLSEPALATGRIYSLNEKGVQRPRLIKSVPPQYDASARAERIQGTVVLMGLIGKDGRLHQLVLKKSLDPRLDPKAILAARQFKFDPARLAGKPVMCQAAIEVRFRLSDRPHRRANPEGVWVTAPGEPFGLP
jgi:periplasmic protein TonB